jgi:hypothetical protein
MGDVVREENKLAMGGVQLHQPMQVKRGRNVQRDHGGCDEGLAPPLRCQ